MQGLNIILWKFSIIKVEEAINQGARLICGGMPTVDQEGIGRFFEPTVGANAENDMVFMVIKLKKIKPEFFY